MLQRRGILLLLLIVGIAIINILYNSPEIHNLQVYHNEIESHIQTLKSINIEDDNFSDLVFLDSIINNKQILFLGEQLHSDGTTFQAKSRLIRYLHEKHNFNIILYEANIHDMWLMNNQVKQQNNDTLRFEPAIGLYPFWWDNEECKPLWKYYNQTLQSNNPIILGGFDIQLTGNYHDKDDRAKDIKRFLTEKHIEIEDYPSFNSIIDQLSYTYKWEYKQFSQTKFDSIQIDLKNILHKLNVTPTEKDNIYYKYIKGIHDYGQLMWNYNPGDLPRMNARDSLMADNLIWQIDSVYSNQKVIVWSANLHLFKSNLTHEESSFIPLGRHIKNKYQNNSYMMAFTSYALTSPNSQDLYSEAGKNSLENILHANKHKHIYLDMNEINPQSFLNKEYFSVINQRANESRKWSEMIDGLFYIDIVNTINYKK